MALESPIHGVRRAALLQPAASRRQVSSLGRWLPLSLAVVVAVMLTVQVGGLQHLHLETSGTFTVDCDWCQQGGDSDAVVVASAELVLAPAPSSGLSVAIQSGFLRPEWVSIRGPPRLS